MDKDIMAIKNFMTSFKKGEGMKIKTKACVEDLYTLDVIFDDDVECYVSDNIPADRYEISMYWKGLNDNSMRKLGMRGIYYSNIQSFSLESGYLIIEDNEKDRIIRIKSR